ncbi:TPA: hypothetical protein RQL04_004489 [Vibrio vulnificus]|nr:hypothetical protein [Vibrio vulnificus]
MAVSEKVKRVIWSRAAGKCAMCKEDLLRDGESEGVTHLIGEVAHIVAEKADGPRGQSELNLESRNQEQNLLLLCLEHHKVIDDDPEAYSVEKLKNIKFEHEAWVKSNLVSNPIWDTKLHQMHYINVPRLSLLCARFGYSIDLSQFGRITALHELGWELNHLMGGFSKLLSAVEIKAIPIDDAIFSPQNMRGMYVSFNHRFRTKNIRMPQHSKDYVSSFTGDLSKDPHVYTKVGEYKVVAFVDRRWVTTSTAFCYFRPSAGHSEFAGIAFVNNVDHEEKIIHITPYVLGLPRNEFMDAFYGAL